MIATYIIIVIEDWGKSCMSAGKTLASWPDVAVRRHRNKEPMLFFYCSVELVSLGILNVVMKNVKSEWYFLLTQTCYAA